MKMKWYTCFTFLVALALLGGCITIPGIKSSPEKTSGSQISTAQTEKGLYSKVPVAMRAPVNEAEFDLKQARAKLELAEEKVKLAELKKERALLERKCADYEMELAKILQKKAELAVEIKKLEAIDNSNLGNKEDNIKRIADLKTDKLKLESEGIQVKVQLDTTELKIKGLTKEIIAQEGKTETRAQKGYSQRKTSKRKSK